MSAGDLSRQVAHNAQPASAPPQVVKCWNCGEPFDPLGFDDRFCRTECRETFDRTVWHD